MTEHGDTLVLRARDFWASLVLLVAASFFLWQTMDIPLWGDNRSGVSGTDWYTSAALVPLGIFSGLMALSLGLLVTSVRSGGAKLALTKAGIGWHPAEAFRFTTLTLTMAAYIVGLVPRVDFIAASGLLITALIFGYHGGHATRAWVSTFFVTAPASAAVVLYFPQAHWGEPLDDWITLAAWASLTVYALATAGGERVVRSAPVIALVAPCVLVTAMAFGFRQNVPARNGVLFKQIEYHYYVTLRPLWRE